MTTPTKRKLADAPPSTRVTRSRLAKQRHDAKFPEEEVKIESLPPKEETDAVEVSDSEEKPRTKKRKPAKTAGGGKKGGGKEIKAAPLPDTEGDEVTEDFFCEEDGEEEDEIKENGGGDDSVKKKRSMLGKSLAKKRESDDDYNFVGEPIWEAEARERWPERYQKKKKSPDADDDMVPAKCHYKGANVDGCVYNLLDGVYVKAEPGTPDYIGRIVEFFESNDGGLYFTAQWFFRVEDTVIREIGDFHDPRRVFLSDEKNDNILDCIVSKINIVQIDPERKNKIPPCDLYYDMSYSVPYSSFANISSEKTQASSEESSIVSFDGANDSPKEVSLLDLYSGCGAMSTGLCHGANLAGLKMETKWAVDMNCYACASLERNHPQAKVRNENAEHFLKLLKEWENLCEKFSNFKPTDCDGDDGEEDGGAEIITGRGSGKEFEVGKILDICYGDPAKIGTEGIKFKVRWKGYGPEEDSWEPIENLGKCEERMGSFVKEGMECNLLPRPGRVDVICGGPPCQGISGYNRFRNSNNPFDDVKNRQMITYMHIVDHLKPKYVLMENVVDILKFAKGFLGRYALSFLVSKNYQARLGIMAAGCYGLPQFRLRAFLWGALPSENLPPFPLPTHDVVVRGGIPNEFEPNLAAYGAGEPRALQKALFLSDAISDLPPVTNFEKRDEMPYTEEPTTDFQRFIRMPKIEMMNLSEVQNGSWECKLFDHIPLQLNSDDYMRVQRIPKKKGANFRDLPGLRVNDNNVIELDPAVERELLPSGKPLVPNYAITFVKGKSLKPFGRLWWDETVPTVVTRAEPHNQIILHPGQDRVLTIRENARIQGFPDYYQLLGPVKQRYIQVGNAVAFPVSRALGYALGLAYQKQLPHTESSMKLPMNFPAIPNNGSESDC